MASKGQKFNKYSDELKMEIVNKYINNDGTLNSLEKEYNISRKTIFNWLKKYRNTGTVKNVEYHRGRIKEVNINYKERYEILKKYQAFLKAQREKK